MQISKQRKGDDGIAGGERPAYRLETITQEPGYHWFGYYDKLQFDVSDRLVLGQAVDFEHRQPRADDVIRVGMVDREANNAWIELGESRAWCWQTGCHLQWRPGYDREVMWNDREGDTYVTRLLNVSTGKHRTLGDPFFAVHPEGRWALGLDFARLEDLRPGYGYMGVRDSYYDDMAPEKAGIYRLDLDSGEKRLLISLRALADLPRKDTDFSNVKHYVNCLLFNPEGSRFAFLHRWREERGQGWPFRTRIMTADAEGGNLYTLNEYGCGHFIWRDNEHLLLQVDGFWLFRDEVGRVEQIGKDVISNSGGHVSYLPGGEWIVGDTYPDEYRRQELYLYPVATGELISLGRYYSHPHYAGETPDCPGSPWRCDLHPRVSRDGRCLCIDTPEEDGGRQMHLVHIGEILDRYAN